MTPQTDNFAELTITSWKFYITHINDLRMQRALRAGMASGLRFNSLSQGQSDRGRVSEEAFTGSVISEMRGRRMLKVRAEESGRVCVLHFEGRIVIGDAIATLHKAVLDQAEASAVLLDLAQVELIDACGLGLLLELRALTQSKGIELRLVNVNRIVQHVLQITRLDTVFEVSLKENMREEVPSLRRRINSQEPLRTQKTNEKEL